MTVASIDIGTNTVLMLIAEITDNNIVVKKDEHAIPRIGKNVTQGSNIPDSKVEQLLEVLKRYKEVIDYYYCEKIICSATNVFRYAANARIIQDKVFLETGINIEIISGEMEALYSYLGAVLDRNNEGNLVIDIGGGSTELVYGQGKKILFKRSYSIGVVLGTEEYFQNDPPSSKEIINFENHVIKTFNPLPSGILYPSNTIAIAGTPTTLSCIQQHLEVFNEEAIEGSVLTINDLSILKDELSTMSSKEILLKYKSVVKGREDVLLSGTIILYNIMKLAGINSVQVSTKGIRYGAIIFKYLL